MLFFKNDLRRCDDSDELSPNEIRKYTSHKIFSSFYIHIPKRTDHDLIEDSLVGESPRKKIVTLPALRGCKILPRFHMQVTAFSVTFKNRLGRRRL